MSQSESALESGGVADMVDAVALRQYRKRREVVTLPSFRVGEGVTALLGPNGAGKSTLLETIATALPLADGSLKVCGHNASTGYGRTEIRRETGFLPQRFAPPGNFLVSDYLRYVAWTKDLPSSDIESATTEVLATVNLSSRADSRIRELSGGMRQRLGIAAALVHSPSFLILDEPTVGLDPEQRYEFREILRTISHSVSTLLSTHLTDDVESICDEVVVMNTGSLLFSGPIEELKRRAPERAALGKEDRSDRVSNQVEAAYLELIRSNA